MLMYNVLKLQLDGGIHTLLDILDSVDLPECNHAAMQQEYVRFYL
jgi:hypothetical protein